MRTHWIVSGVMLSGWLMTSCGSTSTGPSSEGVERPGPAPTLIREFTATPINAGVHPDAFAYRVTATALRGENPCIAENTELWIDRRRDGDTLFLTALREPIDPQRVCTMEYNPTFEELTTEVRGFRDDPRAVVVENVGEMDQRRTLW
jgi:hypothetical protein